MRSKGSFWRRVRRSDGCWEWTGHIHGKTGYGQMRWLERRSVGAHRISWLLHRGPIPAGMLVCHHCDNRRCVRPDHLFLGTHADNRADCVRKGRVRAARRPGEANPNARVTRAQVTEMRALRAAGHELRPLAMRYGIAVSTAHAICSGLTWKDVT